MNKRNPFTFLFATLWAFTCAALRGDAIQVTDELVFEGTTARILGIGLLILVIAIVGGVFYWVYKDRHYNRYREMTDEDRRYKGSPEYQEDLRELEAEKARRAREQLQRARAEQDKLEKLRRQLEKSRNAIYPQLP